MNRKDNSELAMLAIARNGGEPVESYWVEVSVRLDSPLEMASAGVVREYRVNLGVLCQAGQLKEVLSGVIYDGNIIWSDTRWRPVGRESIEDKSIRARTDFSVQRGVWYRSGRILLAE